MGRQLDLNAMLRKASPKTRREILALAAKGGIAAPVLMTMLARDGVKPIAAAPAAQGGTPVKGGTFVVMGHQEVATLSPDFQGASIEWTCITQIHNALVEVDEFFVTSRFWPNPCQRFLKTFSRTRSSFARASCSTTVRSSPPPT